MTTTYSYDTINRVYQRSYSGGFVTTPTVSYYYDNLTNAKGKLTKVSSSVSTTEYTSFDISGRVTGHKQTTDGGDSNGYATAYSYKLSGALDEETYPSGRVVKNMLDTNDELSTVKSKKLSASPYVNYASNFTYNAAGAVTSMELGNLNWEKTVFNARLQPTQIALGKTHDATDLLKLDHSYGTTANNGNVVSQTITVPGLANPFIQNYSYDSLNRLSSAIETNNGSQTWKQTFSFDRYGNRRFDESNTTMPSSFANQALSNPTTSTSNNRLTSTGWAYDLSGNTTADPSNRIFVYDAENKQVSVSDTGGSVGEYSYDGDGRRVKKVVPGTGETTVFVYDAGGKSIAEYSTSVSATPQVQFLTNDHLGSPRINTDRDGNVTARHDYRPFGDEIGGVGIRTGFGYQNDSVRKQFTGYERDNESDLDFAQTRYNNFTIGRFTSPDPLLSSGRMSIPMTWNRYVYVLNNPLRFTDRYGLYELDPSQNWTNDERKAFRNNLKEAQKKLKQIGRIYGKGSNEFAEAQKSLQGYGCEAGVGKCTDRNVVVSKRADLGGEARTDRIDNDTRVMVTFDKGNFSNTEANSGFASQITHEGVHVGDELNYINSGKQLRVTDYDSEKRAYLAESAMGHVMQIDVQGNENSYTPQAVNGVSFPMFLPSWRTANAGVSQVDSIRMERNKSIDALLASPAYGFKQNQPTYNYFPK